MFFKNIFLLKIVKKIDPKFLNTSTRKRTWKVTAVEVLTSIFLNLLEGGEDGQKVGLHRDRIGVKSHEHRVVLRADSLGDRTAKVFLQRRDVRAV